MRLGKALLVLCFPMLVGCTPAEEAIARWLDRPLDSGQQVSCDEWLGASRAGGFPEEVLPIVHMLMWRESRCDPAAENPSGAAGLMQVMPMWADDCGITVEQLTNPGDNLACARHVWEVQGWPAWSTWP